jgi:hypothetical protein
MVSACAFCLIMSFSWIPGTTACFQNGTRICTQTVSLAPWHGPSLAAWMETKAEGKTAAKPYMTACKYPLDLFTARRFREVCREAMPQ